MNIFQGLLLALIEGLTEFLPISSTGHMILASSAMGIHENEFVKTFEIVVQLGAILAISLMYIKRFLKGSAIYYRLIIAFLPTALVGFLAYDLIKEWLFNPQVVAISLMIGGIVLIFLDKRVESSQRRQGELEQMPLKNAFLIGVFQCLSMVPGTSRAAATIIGGVFNGLDKRQSMEFSFLLAVPTMFAATCYDLWKTPVNFDHGEYTLLGLGMLVALVSAWVAVKLFLKLVERFGFRYFGYYRIVLGLLFLIFMVEL